MNTLLAKMQKMFSFIYRHFDMKMTQDRNFLVLFLISCIAGYVNFYRFKCKRFS